MDRSSYRSRDLSAHDWASVWLRHSREHRDEDFWAWDELFSSVLDDPERAWPVILALVQLGSDGELGTVGAGPIEDLVVKHGRAFIDRIEAEAAGNDRFRKALATIWLNTWQQDPELVSRVVVASGGLIEPFYLDQDQAARDEETTKDGA
jgi:hypothetical protein